MHAGLQRLMQDSCVELGSVAWFVRTAKEALLAADLVAHSFALHGASDRGHVHVACTETVQLLDVLDVRVVLSMLASIVRTPERGA